MNNTQKILVFDLDDTLFDSTNQPVEKDGAWNLRFFSEFLPVLSNTEHICILVTKGDEEFQNKKINNLQIRDFFKEIHITVTDEEKHTVFEMLCKKYQGRKMIAIGNRLDCEIRYGKKQGMKTIYIKFGKYAGCTAKDSFEIPDCTLEESDFSRLGQIVASL